jgi:lysophospholipase L1-like esterase
MTNSTSLRKKILISISSLLVTLTIIEFAIRLIALPYKNERYFNKLDLVEDSLARDKTINRNDNLYELFKNDESNIEIITTGDSFTNAGNVNWKDSYPYQLFLNFDKKYDIHNMGICEDTSKGSYIRLKKALEKNTSNKKRIVLLLVGASDMFFSHDESFYQFYNKAMNKVITETYSDEINITDEKKEFELKLFKLISFLSKKIITRYQTKIPDTFSDKDLFNQCFKGLGNKTECLKGYFSRISNNDLTYYNSEVINDLIQAIIYHELRNSDNPEKFIVESLLTLSDSIPLSIANEMFLYNLFSYTNLQSHIANKTVIQIIEKRYLKHQEKINELQEQEITSAQNILNSLKNWSNNENKILKLREEYLNKIVTLTKEKKVKLFLLTYPINYTKINTTIRNIAINRSVELIDINKVFHKEFQAGTPKYELIGDWEHCTQRGYKFMADIITEKLKNYTSKINK